MADGDEQAGHEAGKQWLVMGGLESERANLAATFAGGETTISLTTALYPSLFDVLGLAGTSAEVDFSSSPWLIGFKNAIVEELSEPG